MLNTAVLSDTCVSFGAFSIALAIRRAKSVASYQIRTQSSSSRPAGIKALLEPRKRGRWKSGQESRVQLVEALEDLLESEKKKITIGTAIEQKDF